MVFSKDFLFRIDFRIFLVDRRQSNSSKAFFFFFLRLQVNVTLQWKHSNKHIAFVFPVLICRAYDYDE